MIKQIFIPVVNLSEMVNAFVQNKATPELNDLAGRERKGIENLNALLDNGGKVIFSSVMDIDLKGYYVFWVYVPESGEMLA